jgi:cytochrome P450
MLYIVSSPQAYIRLQKEIDDAISAGKASTPITNAEAKNLPYMQVSVSSRTQVTHMELKCHKAVIYESLRLHPPSFILASKAVPPEGDTVNGKFIPGGTQIAQDIWTLFRKKEIFGDDAYIFRPERWLVADVNKRAEMEKTTELVFGYGRWMCAGKTVAFLELNKIFVEVRGPSSSTLRSILTRKTAPARI